MGNEVKIEIDNSSTGGTFTNSDIIRGEVTLIITSSISLNYIQVKLEGISQTQLQISRDNAKNERRDDRREKRDRKKDKLKTIQDVHKLLYETTIVFPPENVRKVLSAKEFTLTPGEYKYPFEFRIPMKNACVKLLGISNKFLIANGSVAVTNGGSLLEAVSGLMEPNQHTAPERTATGQLVGDGRHCYSQLPPSLSGMGETANIRYFIKVTCKRSSILKSNLRSFDPFIFLPLDLDLNEQALSFDNQFYNELFFRKEMVFRNKAAQPVSISTDSKELPPAPKKGFFEKFFDTSLSPVLSASSKSFSLVRTAPSDVPFGFEVRFRDPAFLIPTKAPSFRMFIISNANPERYSMGRYGKPDESNGLGIIYLQKLKVELHCRTTVSVLEIDGSYKDVHRSQFDKTTTICDNSYHNLALDLKDATRQKQASATTNVKIGGPLYELEIPKRYFANCTLPDSVSPSFTTCNISRSYSIVVTGGFSAEKINDFRKNDEVMSKIYYMELYCSDIKVLSGINDVQPIARKPPMPMRPSQPQTPSTSDLAPQYTRPPPNFAALRDSKPPVPPPPQSPSTQRSHSPVQPQLSSFQSEIGAENDHAVEGMDLPSYDEVLRESTDAATDTGPAHRRQYQQHAQYYNAMDF